MARAKSIYSCTECGATSPKWQGQCPGCAEWNTLVESVAEKATGHRFESLAPTARLQTLSEIEARETERIPTGIGEFDRALGGGLVPGGVVLIGGDPGIGKSTLLLQALSLLSLNQKVLYISGEESGEQVALRARRLSLDTRQLQLMAEINLERILSTLQAEKPLVAVIDSIQTLWSDQLSSAPGSVAHALDRWRAIGQERSSRRGASCGPRCRRDDVAALDPWHAGADGFVRLRSGHHH